MAEAPADAGLAPRDVQLVLFGNAVEGVMHGQEMIRAEVALRRTGLPGVPMINAENACSSSSSAAPSTAGRMCDRLVRKGLIRRTAPGRTAGRCWCRSHRRAGT